MLVAQVLGKHAVYSTQKYPVLFTIKTYHIQNIFLTLAVACSLVSFSYRSLSGRCVSNRRNAEDLASIKYYYKVSQNKIKWSFYLSWINVITIFVDVGIFGHKGCIGDIS